MAAMVCRYLTQSYDLIDALDASLLPHLLLRRNQRLFYRTSWTIVWCSDDLELYLLLDLDAEGIEVGSRFGS